MYFKNLNTMKNLDVLLKLINLTPENTIHDTFNYNVFNSGIPSKKSSIYNCFTSGCLAGELPGIDNDWKFGIGGLYYTPLKHFFRTLVLLMEYFDLPEEIIRYFFYGNSLGNYPDLPANPTIEQVQQHIKNYLIKNEII